jgi:uncharacterized membrane protein YhaH (DUF805 family)
MKAFFKKYFWQITTGRLTRNDYWSAVIGSVFYGIIGGWFVGVASEYWLWSDDTIVVAMVILLVPVYWMGVICQIKRTRDLGISGWWYLPTCIPYAGLVYGVVIGLLPTNYFARKGKEISTVVTA